MPEYTWCEDDDLSRSIVPEEALPKRLALTASGVVTRRQAGGTTALLLCNPHPDSWNSWMLPYGSLAMEAGRLERGVTFGSLSLYMMNLKDQHAEHYEAMALAHVRQLVGLLQAKFVLEQRLSNFSLKLSKSANIWTGYCFAYHISVEGRDANPKVQTAWLTLSDENISAILADGTLEGLRVADNVSSLLRDADAITLVRA